VTFTVLYEDRRGPIPEFGLHRFITQCVHDAISGDHPEYHHVARCLKDHQCKNDAKLLAKCREHVDAISRTGCPVIAVFDNDRVRRLLGLPHDATDDIVRAEILKGKADNVPLCIVLLKQNTESVLRAIANCSSGLDPEVLAKAVERKDMNARDIVFREAAKAKAKTVRECVLQTNPSLKEMVDGLCYLVDAALQIARIALTGA
jgi:hypothetical protein